MKVQVLEKTDSEVQFLVEGIKPAFAGELRRIMMSEVPTMAIEWVEFKKNDSALQDEILANRLGQIPLTYDRKAYNLPSECKCGGKGCSRCQVGLYLKAERPKVIYSSDLKSRDKSVKPVYEKIPIVELFGDQELQFSATAQLGLGKEHVKWQGGIVGYKNKPDIKISGNVKGKAARKIAESCPRKVFKVNKKLKVKNPLDCNMCMQCVEAAEKGEIEVKPVEDSFIFNVETASGLKPDEIVLLALDILEEKMKEFRKKVKKLK